MSSGSTLQRACGGGRQLPYLRLTGRCFLLRPVNESNASCQAARTGVGSQGSHKLECVELTTAGAATSRCPSDVRGGSVPAGLAGNRYYTSRFQSAGVQGSSLDSRLSIPANSSVVFVNGDVVLRLCHSVTSGSSAKRRVVDVTGVETNFLRASEKNPAALLTVNQAVQMMHLHDGYEVPVLGRGDVPVVRLQAHCVYAPWRERLPHRSCSNCASSSISLDQLQSCLQQLKNSGVLLSQTRSLSFRSEMEALQTARIMAATVTDLAKLGERRGPAAGPLLAPIVCDGRVNAVYLKFSRKL